MTVSGMGFELEDLPVLDNSAGQVALRVQRSGEIETRRHRARIEHQCLPAMRGRPVEPAKRVVDAADIIVEFGIGAVLGNGAVDQLQRRLGPAGLVRDQAQKVKTIGMVGVRREKAAVKPLRLGEMPGLMLSCRFRQQRRTGREVCGSR